jgi:sterol-4alpha-carboxylate 3-dehydrogenase (decarboxylating)
MKDTAGEHSVLVVGGCGFVGYHIVRSFAAQSTFETIAVLSRTAARNSDKHVEGVTYHTCDLTRHRDVLQLVNIIQPTVIIHTASPSPVTGTPKEYERVTLHGTENLLRVAKASQHVRVFIYTSSSTLAKGPEHLNLSEDYPLANADPTAPVYAKFKALAKINVLEANNPLPTGDKSNNWEGYLSTGSSRFPIIYGTHDLVTIPGCLNALQKGQTNVQLGDGSNLWDFCSISNCVDSHILLARALLGINTSKFKHLEGRWRGF